MAYVPNATTVTEPIESRSVESAALEFRTLKEKVVDLAAQVATEDAKDLRVPESTVNPIPAVSGRAGKVLGFDASGQPIAVAIAGTDDPSLRADLAASSGASLVGYTPAGIGAVATTVQGKLRETVSVFDFMTSAQIADVQAGTASLDVTAAVQSAINAVGSNGWFGETLLFPDGHYKITAAITIDKNITLSGYGARISSSGARCFDLGSAAYLTDLNAGYYYVQIRGLHITHTGANEVIRNQGIRKVIVEDVRTTGGSHAFYSEGCYGGGAINGCRFQNATSHGVNLVQRNNLFVVRDTAVLASAGYGIALTTVTAENKGIKLQNVDLEGNAGAIYIAGNASNIDIDGCWFENNTVFNITVNNAAGTSNKYGITIHNCQITGAGDDVLIGTDTAGTLIEGVSVFDNEFVDSDLVVIGNGKVANFREWSNRFSATGTKTLPTSELQTTAAGVMPQFSAAPTEPYGYAATGQQGEIRYSATTGRVWIKTNSGNGAGGWMLMQGQAVGDYSYDIATLPTGSTPSVLQKRACRTNNGSATSVTSFAGGFVTQELIIYGLDGGNTTIVHGTNIRLAGGVNFTLGDNDTIHLLCVNGTKWVEVARSNNT